MNNQSLNSRKKSSSRKRNLFYKFIPLLEIIAILTWGILLLKYAVTGQYKLLIHPNYFPLMFASSIVLLFLGLFRSLLLVKSSKIPPNKGMNL